MFMGEIMVDFFLINWILVNYGPSVIYRFTECVRNQGSSSKWVDELPEGHHQQEQKSPIL